MSSCGYTNKYMAYNGCLRYPPSYNGCRREKMCIINTPKFRKVSPCCYKQLGNKLVGTGDIDPAQQGKSCSLSADGKTLAIGGPEMIVVGATWIFIRVSGVWIQQGSKLVGSGVFGNAEQGNIMCIISRWKYFSYRRAI